MGTPVSPTACHLHTSALALTNLPPAVEGGHGGAGRSVGARARIDACGSWLRRTLSCHTSPLAHLGPAAAQHSQTRTTRARTRQPRRRARRATSRGARPAASRPASQPCPSGCGRGTRSSGSQTPDTACRCAATSRGCAVKCVHVQGSVMRCTRRARGRMGEGACAGGGVHGMHHSARLPLGQQGCDVVVDIEKHPGAAVGVAQVSVVLAREPARQLRPGCVGSCERHGCTATRHGLRAAQRLSSTPAPAAHAGTPSAMHASSPAAS